MITYHLTEQILSAGQPEPDDWQTMADEGYQTIINLRGDPERAAAQASAAAAVGLRYVHLPLPAYELEAPHLAAFQAVLEEAGEKVVIHCRTASRVGLLWMLHRMLNQGWTQEQAEAELIAAGYDEDSLETFRFCSEDFLERNQQPAADV